MIHDAGPRDRFWNIRKPYRSSAARAPAVSVGWAWRPYGEKAKRGHTVTLFEADGDLVGQLKNAKRAIRQSIAVAGRL